MGSVHQLKMKDPRDPFVVTAESIAYHKRKAEQERAEAIRKVPELRTFLVTGTPLLTATPLAHRVACADAIDAAVESFGLQTVLRCLAAVCAANNIDIATKTINDVAAGEEQQ
jgi:hypothetical protein